MSHPSMGYTPRPMVYAQPMIINHSNASYPSPPLPQPQQQQQQQPQQAQPQQQQHQQHTQTHPQVHPPMYVIQPNQQKQDGSAGQSMLPMAPNSAVYPTEVDSPATTPGGGEKRPKLRVQIPESAEDAAGRKPTEHNTNPSPSTFYPEFYQQNELPSPLNFSATPTANPGTFNWPPISRDYRPSPLVKVET
ncbi:hypothetical protein PHYBLDRAFT_157411 [Phycomyces blakesleeanus NRRL 1555(-)]|uniref:Uncharacterized protein n=1 Tax=Phycomyces blakesleeanus (strain ATCC 8743b / DSM 1359 / FGSC 10004 / NBRC 33097 / NRRL 1555) TaxID=763407 RepID=A0A167QNX8_PHYB8|nr:hypothetical protein PHYBLDRAFT_157411 [Phycomyces blakesleeanus NRRL 1555(-)]OAD79984.1 hypothetical protein PHYBLDRAFT_157411 [Phycomyces blakesleeanus NRRL 1555(-)]|eukprot:XP_018298024.1 hypothetical protein PHYBLDRAFT_157411 [Phycomyces blakesleeanus NRRL 1555(-)]